MGPTDFVSRFVKKSDLLNMSEAQAFVSLPTFLADLADTKLLTTCVERLNTEQLHACPRLSSICCVCRSPI